MILAALLFAASAQTVSTLCQTEDVVINPDYKVRRLVGCGEGFSENTLWHLDRLDSRDGSLDAQFTRPAMSGNAVVYVVDSGIDRSHDEFQRADGTNVIGGIDASTPNGAVFGPCADVGPELHPCFDPKVAGQVTVFTHGTGVASIIGGRTVGVAPEAKLVSVLTAFTAPAAWLDAFNRIIRHAWDPSTPQFRTAVINISGGVPFRNVPSEALLLEQITQKIRDMIGGVDAEGRPDPSGKRFFFVVAAGNITPAVVQCGPDGGPGAFPGRIAAVTDGILSVGGITAENAYWSGSCSGEVYAPAENILAASNTAHDYYRKDDASGTSFSAPIVSGIAARMLAMEPELSPEELERRIKSLPAHTTDGRPAVTLYAPPRRRAR